MVLGFGLLGQLLDLDAGEFIGTLGMVVGWVSYIFAGGLSALKIMWKIAISPIDKFLFPWNFAFMILTIMIAILLVAFLPIYPVYKSYKASQVG